MDDTPAEPSGLRLPDRTAWLECALAAAALALGVVGAGFAAWAVLAIYALLGRVQAIRALALSWLFASLNPALVDVAADAALGRYLVLGAAAASTGLRALSAPRRGVISVVELCTLALGACVLLHAALLSQAASISALKGLSWLAAALVAVGGWTRLTAGERDRLGRSLLIGLGAVVIGGLPLLASPAGYASWGPDFRGMLRHPTQYGVAAALLGAWSAALLFERRRPPLALMAVAGCSSLAVVLSGSRVAAVATFAGVAAGLLAVALASGRPLAALPGLRSWRLRAFVAAALLAAVYGAGDIAAFLDRRGADDPGRFRAQSSVLETVLDHYMDSRGREVSAMLENIRGDPWAGIGFGVASRPERFRVERGPFGIPVSAPVEKGVLPLALLEELGMLGLAAAAVWVACLVRRAARRGVAALAVCLTILFINLGESVLMSPGGVGLACLILLGWAAAGGDPAGAERGGSPLVKQA